MSSADTPKPPAFDPTQYLSDLKGRKYLEVKNRLLWLRTVHPDAVTMTDQHLINADIAIFRASVSIPGGGSATGWGSETPRDFGDYIEKAETKALGRALAALGFGTQFCLDFDEPAGSVVDSPVARPQPARPLVTMTAAQLSGKPAAPAERDDGPSEAQMRKLHAVVREQNWQPDAVRAAMRDLWSVASSKDLTKYQCGLLIDIVEGRMQIERDAAGKARLGQVPPADGLLPESALPWGGDTGEGR